MLLIFNIISSILSAFILIVVYKSTEISFKYVRAVAFLGWLTLFIQSMVIVICLLQGIL